MKVAARVLGAPGGLHAVALHHDGGIEEHRGRREAVLERAGIQERLESRARLAARLGCAIELVREEVESPHERRDGAILGIKCNERALRRGRLRKLCRAAAVGDHKNDIARREDVTGILWRRPEHIRTDLPASPGKAVPIDLREAARLYEDARCPVRNRHHDRRR